MLHPLMEFILVAFKFSQVFLGFFQTFKNALKLVVYYGFASLCDLQLSLGDPGLSLCPFGLFCFRALLDFLFLVF